MSCPVQHLNAQVKDLELRPNFWQNACQTIRESCNERLTACCLQDAGQHAALTVQVSSLREQLHATYRMAEAMREERDDAQTAIDQMVADHHEAQLDMERQMSDLHASAQVKLRSGHQC